LRYFLIDRIDELKPYSYAIGTKCVSLADDCFEHHFPGQPVFPGALLIESMAQLGGALMELSMRGSIEPLPRCAMSSVKAKLREFVRPGDKLCLRAEVVSHREDSALVRVSATRDDRKVCEGEILYVYVRIDDAALQASREQLLDVITRSTKVVAQ
jgi:3-hydroxymyristoyl/3-hydroxydecanoyl-(acyl carrier protein) dehydratase